MEKTIRIRMEQPMTTRMASMMAVRIAAADARVLLCRGNMTVNAKSLMGLVSLSLKDGDEIRIVADGPQAQEVIAQIEEMLGA